MKKMDKIRILSPTSILGYGFPQESLAECMRREPLMKLGIRGKGKGEI